MKLLDHLKQNTGIKAEFKRTKLLILNRMTMQQLATLHDEYLYNGSELKDRFVAKDSIADLITTAIDSRNTKRGKIIENLANELSLDLIVSKAKEFKLDISDLHTPEGK